MVKRSVVGVGVTILATSMTLSACGSRSENGGGAGNDSGAKVATIGVIAPLSGDLSALGLGIQHSVELAVKQANDNQTIPGWTLRVDAKDDEGKPEPGKNAATALAGDNSVVGVVGTLNSSVAQNVQPVLAAANIPMVSPANTNPSLTRGADFATAPERTYASYFRTCTTDDVQGPFAAQYLLGKGMRNVATIHDKKTYGQGLVGAFTKAFTDGGGTITAATTINPDDANFQTAITAVSGSSPQAVYYGGEFPEAGPLSQQMKSAGLNVPLMGGDGIYDPKFISLAGATATNDLATSVGAPTDSLANGQQFLQSYQQEGYSNPAGAYGAYSYDAANAIIEGLKTSLANASDPASARQATVDAIGQADFAGITGQVAFDQYGDSKTRTLTVYQVQGGAWKPVQTGEPK